VARLPRLSIAGELHALSHHAAPGRLVFPAPGDAEDYRAALLSTSREAGVAIHAYVLLPDRVQMLLTPETSDAISKMMQRLGLRHAAAYRRRHGPAGGLWESRFRATVIEPASWLLEATVLVETLPVDRGLTAHAAEWRDGSAVHHLGLRSDPVVTEHPLYWQLGNTPFEREAAHRRLLEQGAVGLGREDFEAAMHKGWALGSPDFLQALGQTQARPLQPRRRGRPPGRPRGTKSAAESDPI
jgi:putative transposase